MSPALIEDAAKRSSVLWVVLPEGTRLAWHVWHDDAIYLVVGGGEQNLPGLTAQHEIEVVLRSKDNGAQLVRFPAAVEVVDQKSSPDVVAALAKERLNAPDATGLQARWAKRSAVVRLRPTG